MKRAGPSSVGVVAALAGVIAVAACGSPATTSETSLTIFAASSLKPALDTVRSVYARAHPDLALTISTDSSAALESQIEQGAPADVFLSADTANPQKLVAAGFGAGPPVVFAGNALTVIVPADNPAGITSPADLGKPGVKVIAAGDAVPITKYAAQLIGRLAAAPGYPAAFAAAYTSNIVSRADNVAAVVTQIALGQGDAAIVYVTDAATSSKVATIAVPADLNIQASYAGVVVNASKQQAEAHAFLAWLRGPDGQAALSTFGFLPAPS